MKTSLPPWVSDRSKKEIFVKRSKIIRAIRDFFYNKDFLEVETPILSKTPDPNPNIHSFQTSFYNIKIKTKPHAHKKLFLSASPEHAMKIILCSGFRNIFQITRFFRNEETGNFHNPEFTGLEWYETGVDYNGIMKTCEELFLFIAESVFGISRINYQGREIDLTPPWERISVREAFLKFAGIDLNECESLEDFSRTAAKKDIAVSEEDSWETLFFKVYLHYVERNLVGTKPVFLIDYPAALSSLAKKKIDNPMVVERFEIFAGNMEIGNAFTELNDPVEQKERFLDDLRKKYFDMPLEKLPLDHQLIDALKYGLPDCAGIAIGIDRLIMLFLDCPSIQDVMFFPFSS